jgi:two-component system alkaline phosphatase synthesis response regulator PhoP
MPIIMITARNSDIDRVLGLELGADDYVGKPFSVQEVLARVKVQVRRRAGGVADREPDEVKFGEVVVNLRRQQVRRRSRLIPLSGREFELLRYFIAHQGQLVSREQLLSDVWGYSSMPLTRTVDNFVAKLRRKLERDPQNPRHILTLYGTGYRFVP